MKSIFSSNFLPQRQFWMGAEGDYSTLTSNLDYAMDLYGKVNDWLSKTTNPRDALGTDADQFQAVNTDIRGLFDSAVGIAEKLHAGMSPDDDEVSTVRRFNDDAGILYGILQAHPITTPTGPAGAAQTMIPNKPGPTGNAANQIEQAITQGAQQYIQATKGPQPVKGAIPPVVAAPAKSYTVPLLVGGGIAAAIVVALIATAK